MARSSRYLVVCLKTDSYNVSLQQRKLYVAIPDVSAAKHGLVRVFDESGEDYLYPSELFVAVELPTSVRRAVLTAAKRDSLPYLRKKPRGPVTTRAEAA